MTRHILITGASGFVGTAFRRWFAEHEPDAAVLCVDIVRPLDGVKPQGRFYLADVRTWFSGRPGADGWVPPTTGRAHGGYDLVVHLAAVVGGRATIDNEPMSVATDLSIDADWWQWVLRARPRQVVYFSSSAAYPIDRQTGLRNTSDLAAIMPPDVEHPGIPRPPTGYDSRRLRVEDINLDRIRQPDAIYGLVKLVGEQQARHVAHVLEGQTTVNVYRPFSGYGVGQALDYPAPSIVARAVARENPITLWSDTVRDFVYIDDVVEIVMRTMSDAPTGQVYTDNIASGRPTSFVEFARLAADIVGYSPEIRVLPGMPTGVQYRVGMPGMMRPSITLEQGVARMVDAAARRS